MRTFAKDSPEFFAFMIEGHDEVFKIPLISSLPISKILEMDDAEASGRIIRWQIGFFRAYIGDVVDELSAGTVGEIMKAWQNATKESGAEAGE